MTEAVNNDAAVSAKASDKAITVEGAKTEIDNAWGGDGEVDVADLTTGRTGLPVHDGEEDPVLNSDNTHTGEDFEAEHALGIVSLTGQVEAQQAGDCGIIVMQYWLYHAFSKTCKVS
jgi:hypothetical protein